MNFTSQICTTEEQSKRLLALGLRMETADMGIVKSTNEIYVGCPTEYSFENGLHIPAWSLHRLIEMIPSFIDIGKHNYMFSIIQGKLFSYGSDIAGNAFLYGKGSVYESAIYTIEWLIIEGYFNKEYLK